MRSVITGAAVGAVVGSLIGGGTLIRDDDASAGGRMIGACMIVEVRADTLGVAIVVDVRLIDGSGATGPGPVACVVTLGGAAGPGPVACVGAGGATGPGPVACVVDVRPIDGTDGVAITVDVRPTAGGSGAGVGAVTGPATGPGPVACAARIVLVRDIGGGSDGDAGGRVIAGIIVVAVRASTIGGGRVAGLRSGGFAVEVGRGAICTPVGGALRARRGGSGGNRRPHAAHAATSSAFSALQNGQNLKAG